MDLYPTILTQKEECASLLRNYKNYILFFGAAVKHLGNGWNSELEDCDLDTTLAVNI